MIKFINLNYILTSTKLQQACVQLLCTLTTWHCPHSHAAAAVIDRYLLLAGPTAANLQQRVCCCGPMLEQRDDGHRTVSQTLLGHSAYYAGSANNNKKGKVFPYSLPSVGPGADPGVQAVSPQVT